MEMLLVNPKKRRGKVRRRKRARARARARKARRRSLPAGARPASGYVVGAAPIRRRKLNPRRRAKVRYRRKRNPISLGAFRPARLTNTVLDSLPGAFGALGLDIALGFLPIPITWKTGIPGYLTKIAGAVGLGMLARTVVSERTAGQLTTGALTVMFHGVLRELMTRTLPGVPLGMYLPPGSLAYAGSGANPVRGVGAYLPDISGNQWTSSDVSSLETYSDFGEYY